MNNRDIQWSRRSLCFSHDLLSFQDRWAALQTQEVISELVKTGLGALIHSKRRRRSHFSCQLFVSVLRFSSSYETCLSALQMSVRIKGSYLAFKGWNICLDTWELSVREWCRNVLCGRLACFRPMALFLANCLMISGLCVCVADHLWGPPVQSH